MARTIDSVDALDAYIDDVLDETEQALMRGAEGGLMKLAEEIAIDAPHNPEVMAEGGNPWNLAAGIGVDERIPAQLAKIPGLAERRDFDVKLQGGDVTGVLGYAMTYAKHVGAGEWDRPALGRADQTIGDEQELELAKVEGRVA